MIDSFIRSFINSFIVHGGVKVVRHGAKAVRDRFNPELRLLFMWSSQCLCGSSLEFTALHPPSKTMQLNELAVLDCQ